MQIELCWLEHGAGLPLPMAQSGDAAGMDLHAAVPAAAPMTLEPGAWLAVPCGFAMALPPFFEAQVRPRSGLAAKYGVTVLNAPGTIDADYRGEIKVLLINHSPSPFIIRRGDRIAQMVIGAVIDAHFVERNTLDNTIRGAAGFGSTGIKG